MGLFGNIARRSQEPDNVSDETKGVRMLKDLWSIKPAAREDAPTKPVSSDIYAVASRDHAIPPRRRGRRK